MNDELQLKVEQYISGSMSASDALDFEKLMETDAALKAEVTLAKQLNFHLSGTTDDSEVPNNEYTQNLKSFMESEEAKELKETLRTVQSERRVPKFRSKKRRIIFAAAAAVVIFLISAIGLIFKTEPGTEKLYAQYYSTNDLPSVIQRGTSNSLLKQGAVAFQNENFSDALAYFEQYDASTEEPDMALYLYKGATLLELGNYYGAIQEFELAIDSQSIDASKGFWFKAMAYLKSGDVSNAKYVLSDIASHVWYYNHDKAKELLKKLD
ncbi:MAG: hypothetical protein AAF489_08835 [Bacteroidota bacterium]